MVERPEMFLNLLPQINRLADFGRVIWKFDLPSLASGLIGGIHNLENFASIFPCFHADFFSQHTIDKVLHFLWETVVPNLFEHGKGVAFGYSSFFHGVAVTFF